MTRPDRDALEGVRLLSSTRPRPVVMFVDEDDPDFMQAAIDAGVSSYNVGSVTPAEMKPMLRAAVALFRKYQQTDQARQRPKRDVIDRGDPDPHAQVLRTRGLSLAAARGDIERTAHRGHRPDIGRGTRRGPRMTDTIRLGVLRLTDGSPTVLAEADGLFASEGIDVALQVEPSWANVARVGAVSPGAGLRLREACGALNPRRNPHCAGQRYHR